MRWLILFSFCIRLFANSFDYVSPSSTEEIASLSSDLLIDGYISPFSGQPILSEIDLCIKGAQDLFLKRHYIPPQILGSYDDKDGLDCFFAGKALLQLHTKGWITFPHLWAGYNRHSRYFQVTDPQGMTLEFSIDNGQGILRTSSYGCTNLQRENPSSFNDIRNIDLVIEGNCLKVTYPNGVCHIYLRKYTGRYRLEKEILPSGKAIFYEYDEYQDLKRIYSSDINGKHIYGSISKIEKNRYVASDGRKANHIFETKHIQGEYKKKHRKEKRTYRFEVMKEVFNPFYPNKMRYNNKTLLTFYDNRAYPISFSYYQSNKEIARVQTFSTPFGSIALSYDFPIAGQKEGYTKVTYPNGSEKVYRFNSNLLLIAIEHIYEGKLYHQKLFTYDSKQHISKIEIFDANKNSLIARHFECDAVGNPIYECLKGDFGSFATRRVFSKNRLIKEEKDDGLCIEYTYLGDTHLATSKTVLADGKPIRKTLYVYDEANNLIEKIEDKKKITKYLLYQEGVHLHRVRYKEELTFENELTHKTFYCYDNFGNICKEDHYGSDGSYAYSIHKTYDEKGNLLEEINPLEQKATYQYNPRGYCTQEIPFSNQLTISKEYDAKGRLICLKENDRITQFAYNSSDELIEEINYLGLKTTYTYHPLHGNPVLIEKEPISFEMTYDVFGREIERKDALGTTTKTTYNSYNDPIEITYPNGGKEKFSYSANGRLKEHVDPDNLKTSYTYDPLGRVLSKRIGAYTTTYTYDGYHLLKEKDPLGFYTYYKYNLIGQKIAEEKEKRVTKFAYDRLGFLSLETKKDRSIQYQNDALGRVLEKDIDQVLKTAYTYDPSGNILSVSQGKTSLYFSYDAHNRLIEKIDGNNAKTTISYEEKDQILVKKIKDPNQVKKIETYNAHNLLLKKEIPSSCVENFTYDEALRLIRQDHITFTYTPDGYRSSMTEANQRTTFWSYTPQGKVQTKTKPDGTVLHYEYNSQGNLIKVEDREFTYDELGRLIQGSGFIRKLDPFGNILKEEFSNGLWVESSYDDWDRPTQRTFPDQSSIAYKYEGPFLKKVLRYSSNGSIIYTHAYDQYDEKGNLLSETGLFTTTYTYDTQGRKTSQLCPYFQEEFSYDLLGNLVQKGKIQYTYDPASRLTSQSGQFSAKYDTHHNFTQYNQTLIAVDDLNQIKEDSYDPNGNLIKPVFKFDIFDQLITSDEETYDALGRRLQKGLVSYLYIDREEIASFEKGSFKELKVLGDKNPVSIEIYETPYTPVIDVQGVIRLLIDSKTNKILKNTCNAFGENLTDEIPYAYLGKRYDPKTNLIYFGKRYYDPSSRRWLTPDPIGPTDHSNLYQYVFNNPFRYQDLNGESVLGFLCGIGQMIIGGALIATGTVIEITTCGTYTIGFTFQAQAGASLIVSGYTQAMFNVEDLSMDFPGSTWKNINPFDGMIDRLEKKGKSKSDSGKEYKKPKSNISGKEGAKDVPSWVKGNRPYKEESGKDFAKRLMDEKYGSGNYEKGTNSPFNQIKKWGDRSWE